MNYPNTFAYILLLLIFAILLSCKKTKNANQLSIVDEAISDIEKNIVIPKELESNIILISDYSVIVTFNGECASCILSFIEEFVRKIRTKESNVSVNYVYIAYSPDIYSIEYYLDLYKISLDNRDILISDPDQVFKRDNSFAQGNPMNVILVKKNGQIITTEAPHESQEIFNIYINHGVINELNIKNGEL